MACAQEFGRLFVGQPYLLGYKGALPQAWERRSARLGWRDEASRTSTRVGSLRCPTTEQIDRFQWRSLRLWVRKTFG